MALTHREIQEHFIYQEIGMLRATTPMLDNEYHKQQCRDKIEWLEERLEAIERAYRQYYPTKPVAITQETP